MFHAYTARAPKGKRNWVIPWYFEFFWRGTSLILSREKIATHSLSQINLNFEFADFSVQDNGRQKSTNALGFLSFRAADFLNNNSGRVVLATPNLT